MPALIALCGGRHCKVNAKKNMCKFIVSVLAAALLCACNTREPRQSIADFSFEGKNLYEISGALGGQSIDIWSGKPAPLDSAGGRLLRGRALTDISKPRLELFLTDGGKGDNGFVIVCPGGGYAFLNGVSEGYNIAKILNKMGV